MTKKIIFIIMAALLFAGGCGKNEPDNILLEEPAREASDWAPDLPEEDQEQPEGQEGRRIYVQVSGSVAEPGVYELAEGSRIFQAVELAGGVLETADAGRINQAEVVEDGQMIYIPAFGEEEPSQDGVQQEDGRINLNTATEAELMTLPGIGASRAGSILGFREANGGFSQVEDLMKVEGIKDGVFSKIKDSVKVD